MSEVRQGLPVPGQTAHSISLVQLDYSMKQHHRISRRAYDDQMRNLKELKDIVTKLEFIEEIKDPLQCLLVDFNTVLEEGREWIDNKGNKTYQEMQELLDSEIAKSLRQCFCIGSSVQEKCSETVLTMEQLDQSSNSVPVNVSNTRKLDEHILGQIEEMNANITSHGEMLQTIQQKIKKLEKSCKSVAKLKQQNEAKFEEIMKELHEASNCMSNLSEELNITKEKEQIHDNKIQEISQDVRNYLEQRDLIDKQKEKVEILEKDIERITDELEKSKDEIKTKDCELVQLKEMSAEAFKSLETKKVEMVKLKIENETANEIIKEKDKATVTAIGVDECVSFWEEYKKCLKALKKHGGLNKYYQGNTPSATFTHEEPTRNRGSKEFPISGSHPISTSKLRGRTVSRNRDSKCGHG